jgi:hypothetical protein
MVRAAKPQANRTDLLAPTPSPQMPGQPNGRPNQPVTVPTGLPYGQAGQMAQGESAAPLPNSQGSQLAQALQDAKQSTPSPEQTGLTPLDAPSERPYEHVMTGASGPFGIGAPAAGPPPAAGSGENGQMNGQLANLFDMIAQVSGSTRMQQLAQQARSNGT